MNQKNYLVSVITPFHNTNLTYFSKCFDSMVNQTIGFENVEWIITLHNCEPEYVEAVYSMAASWPNILIFELYNDNRTASSPRNECLKHATAEYICFLDADDYYFYDCLEVAVRIMKEYDGDWKNLKQTLDFRDYGLIGDIYAFSAEKDAIRIIDYDPFDPHTKVMLHTIDFSKEGEKKQELLLLQAIPKLSKTEAESRGL